MIQYHILQAFETEIKKQAIKTQYKRARKRHDTPARPNGTCTDFVNNFNNLYCMIFPSEKKKRDNYIFMIYYLHEIFSCLL